MLKILLAGGWICAVTLASSYTAAAWKTGQEAAAEDVEFIDGVNYQKTEPINVPMIADGAIHGYVIAQFVYTADARTLKQLAVPPDPFIVDEAFRTIYGDERLDFRHLEKYDLGALTARIAEVVNARFKADLLQDVLVEQFSYISSDEVRAQGGKPAGTPVLGGDFATPPEPAHAEGGH
jgi:hypothetical protein